MQFPTLKSYLNWAKGHAPKGPFAFIFAQDDIELTHPVAHHIKLGFRQTVVLADPPLARPADLPAETAFVRRAAKSSRYQPRDEMPSSLPCPDNGFIAAIMANIYFTRFANPAALEKSSPSPPKSAARRSPRPWSTSMREICGKAQMGWMSQAPIWIGLGITQRYGKTPKTSRSSGRSISLAAYGGALRNTFHGKNGGLIAWLCFRPFVG